MAKSSLQVDLQGKSARFDNTPEGRGDLLARLPAGAFAIMEATGSYHLPLLDLLQSRGIPAAVVNPARAKSFAKARGTLAKTDPVDAAMLSAFGRAMQPASTSPREPARVELKELMAIREALVAETILWRNLMEHQQSATARKLAAGRLKQATLTLAKLEQRITRSLEQSAHLAPVAQVIRSCKGVGLVTTAVLISEMPELGRVSRREIAALAGLAPYANDSGKSEGKRSIRAGRPKVKRALYLASLSVVRHHPDLSSAYKELRAKGKPAKVALVAIARKLLVILNARLRDHYVLTGEAAGGNPSQEPQKLTKQ
ncbi:MAG: IS110 family transposase [Verrucomicrobiota bacterium]